MAKTYRARRWRPTLPDAASCWLLAHQLKISPILAQVLHNRGFTTPDLAREFITAGREQMLDPFLLKDMDKAVHLLRTQIAKGKPIMVYGDYDVDGVTGTTILVLALRAMGATVDYYIPNRFTEGYGMNVGALGQIAARGYDFVLSVDTGITAVGEALVAKELGITLVISDHHEPGPTLPDVPALINPKRPDCDYPFKGLSGVGVAFKLALALEAPGAWELMDIVTLGTIADMVPLVGENRAIVREGLAALGNTKRLGLRALMEVAGVKLPVTATHIGFSLGPRINALGRMGSAMLGVELLTTQDPERATELARYLDDENRSRQEVEATILAEALDQAEAQSPAEKSHVLVLAGEGWHHGVVGICASKVLEAYHRPTILLSINGDEVRGSARSISAFHMHKALSLVSDLFSKWGGHAAAAGMTLKRKGDVGELRRRLNELAAEWLTPEDLVPHLTVDAELALGEVNDHLLHELGQLEPHGIGNPSPLFAVKDLVVADVRTMGKEQQHLKLFVRGAGAPALMEAVGWNMAPACPAVGARIQAAGFPEYDTYLGRHKLRLTLRDLQVIASPDDGGFPVNVAAVPDLPLHACLQWDPLAGEGGGAHHLIDARDHALSQALEALSAPKDEVAATRAAPSDEDIHQTPEPTRQWYIEALAQPAGSRLLILTSSPWAAVALVVDLKRALPERRGATLLWLPGDQEPERGTLVVAPYGLTPRTAYTDTVLYHPPFSSDQLPSGRIHLLWQAREWELTEAALGWPYPNRDLLLQFYPLLKAGRVTAALLAQTLREITGPWNQLRLDACLTVCREIGLIDQQDQLVQQGKRLQLDVSERYRRGMEGRESLSKIRQSDWTGKNYTL